MINYKMIIENGRRICAKAKDEVISRVTICDIEFQWGSDTYVMVGGIASVGTNPKFRRRGIAKAL